VKAILPASIALLAAVVIASGAQVDPVVAAASPVVGASGRPAAAGGAILFSSNRDFRIAYYVVNGDGSGLKQVLPTGGGGAPVWSPDGRWLAFLRSGDLYLMSRTESVRRVATEAGYFSWSPDGKRIVYSDSRRERQIVEVATGRRVKTRPLENARCPRWSPDGKWIAFFRDERLWAESVDGASLSLLGGYNMSSCDAMSWAPDGRRLVFVERDGVFVVNADGTGERRLFRDARGDVAWSPRGDLIAVAGAGALGSRVIGLYVVRPDGTGRRRLLTADAGSPVWSPDGRTVAVATDGDVWTVDVTSGRRRQVTPGYGYSSSPVHWHPRRLPTAQLPGTPVSWAIPSDSLAEPRLLKTQGRVEYLVADGSTVATATDPRHDLENPPIRWCLETWNPSSGALTRSAWGVCSKPRYCCSLGAGGLGDLAFAGDRFAWVTFRHFAGRDLMDLYSVTLELPRPLSVSFCDSGCLFDVEGKGGLVVFDTWTQSCSNPSYPSPCAFAPRKNDRLFRLDGRRAVQIASSPGALAPLAVDAGRILVDRQDGTLELLRSDGSSLGTVRYEPGNLRGAKLQGRDLVVLTQGTIEHHDAATGARLHEWPLAAGDARLEDVQSGVAVYVSGLYVYLVRLVDGRTVALPAPPGTGPVYAQLEASGLFYSYQADDRKYPGRVAFLPFDELPLP